MTKTYKSVQEMLDDGDCPDLAEDFRKRKPWRDLVQELRQWWSFDQHQQHTHSWHSREDFIEKRLPDLVDALIKNAVPVQPDSDSGG